MGLRPSTYWHYLLLRGSLGMLLLGVACGTNDFSQNWHTNKPLGADAASAIARFDEFSEDSFSEDGVVCEPPELQDPSTDPPSDDPSTPPPSADPGTGSSCDWVQRESICLLERSGCYATCETYYYPECYPNCNLIYDTCRTTCQTEDNNSNEAGGTDGGSAPQQDPTPTPTPEQSPDPQPAPPQQPVPPQPAPPQPDPLNPNGSTTTGTTPTGTTDPCLVDFCTTVTPSAPILVFPPRDPNEVGCGCYFDLIYGGLRILRDVLSAEPSCQAKTCDQLVNCEMVVFPAIPTERRYPSSCTQEE